LTPTFIVADSAPVDLGHFASAAGRKSGNTGDRIHARTSSRDRKRCKRRSPCKGEHIERLTGRKTCACSYSSLEEITGMEIKRSGSQPSGKGPADWFTGTVRIDPLFEAPDPARVVGASVTFEPGARTAWHTHPLGQTLLVTSGCGRAQRWGGPIEEIRPGDVIWFAPGEKHWHGAAPATALTHIAVQEKLNGKAVDWMEKVSDEQYPA
jgi:quercetin dioxygenase-like cupin family protein